MPARILVVEDNAANLELVRYLLEHAGHAVLVARDGMAGVETALRVLPDLVLCDLQMPLLDGYGLLERLRGHPASSATPIVAVTAFSMRGDESRVLTAGFDGYVSKPIDPDTFVARIEAFLPPGLRHG
jgi:two-component system, cell cycle response regulator DivK